MKTKKSWVKNENEVTSSVISLYELNLDATHVSVFLLSLRHFLNWYESPLGLGDLLHL